MSDLTTGAEGLLGQVRLLKEKHDALAAANGENFNVFELLGMETDEVRTHSAILADLLDPRGSHGQGVAFARLFGPLRGLSDDELKSARVGAEVAVGGDSRLDILIETHRWCIVIENKIYAADQERQLERYHEFASSRNKRFAVYYLTLQGDAPSKSSLGGLPEGEIQCISYQEDVLPWLDECIKVVARVPRIREVLTQYQAVLCKLTGVIRGKLTMELKDLLKQRPGDTYHFELAPAIAKALTEVSVEAEWSFWDALRECLVEATEPGGLLELDSSVGDAKQVSPEVLLKAHGSGKERWGYGWTFRVLPKLRHLGRDSVETRLRVTCDGGWAKFGLIAVERTADGWRWLPTSEAAELFNWWSPRLAGLGATWRAGDDWYLGWCYPGRDVDLRKTPALDSGVMRTFLEQDALQRDAVGPLVAEIRATIRRLVGMSTPPPS